jgi:hypothetical protein
VLEVILVLFTYYLEDNKKSQQLVLAKKGVLHFVPQDKLCVVAFSPELL